MKGNTLFTKTAAGLSSVALALALSACSHTNSVAKTTSQQTGEIRTEQTAQQQATSGETLGSAPAPANAQGVSAPSTPAIISGPAAVDSSGRVSTSSSVGSTGNASATGLNTNVNIIPKNQPATVTVTETPQPAPVVVETPAPAPVVVETPPPAPAPVGVETPAPMTSSTTTVTQTRHRRLRKD